MFLVFNVFYVVSIWKQSNSVYEEKIDWNDYVQMTKDRLRSGPGEHGEAFQLTDPLDQKENEKLFEEYGLAALVSDKISVNRSIPDFRHPECLSLKYPRHLPKVSIVIIFNNELFSVFKRTLHSLYNRTPHKLVEEVILVNDKSTYDYLYDPLKKYIEEHFPLMKFIIVNMKERVGLMRARVEGAKRAKSEFIFISEPHCEMTYNWLPPLLEPLLNNERIVTVPIIDNVEYNELNYYENDRGNLGSRGVFDWGLQYQKLKRFPVDDEKKLDPFPIPVMTGGIYMIRKKYFFEIGPYDEELLIWGAENIEMSLKINLCGGELMEVPCSRIGHMFRAFTKSRKHEKGIDFYSFNQKRVVEVWFDDYKKYVYAKNSNLEYVEVGDLTKAKAFKDKLKCKSFEYFLNVTAPDLNKEFPMETSNFASGTIQLFNSNLCLKALKNSDGAKVILADCIIEIYQKYQQFILTYKHEIKNPETSMCLDYVNVTLYTCKKLLFLLISFHN